MSILTAAIKNIDVESVRIIIRNEHKFLSSISPSDPSPLILAKEVGNELDDKIGIKKIEVALVLATDWRKSYSIDELRILLVDLISELSEECWSASWNNGIEYELWELINGNSDNLTVSFWQRRGDMEAVSDLKKLKEVTHSWGHWPDTEANPVPISLDEWEQILTGK